MVIFVALRIIMAKKKKKKEFDGYVRVYTGKL